MNSLYSLWYCITANCPLRSTLSGETKRLLSLVTDRRSKLTHKAISLRMSDKTARGTTDETASSLEENDNVTHRANGKATVRSKRQSGLKLLPSLRKRVKPTRAALKQILVAREGDMQPVGQTNKERTTDHRQLPTRHLLSVQKNWLATGKVPSCLLLRA
jgi:hypothetical protein